LQLIPRNYAPEFDIGKVYVWSRLPSGSQLLIEKVPLQLGLQLSLPKGWHHQNCRHDNTVVLLYCSVVLCIQSCTYSGRL